MKILISFFLSVIVLFANTNRISTSDGITCESNTISPYEVESYIEAADTEFDGTYNDGFDTTNNDATTVGVRFIYKFGGQKPLDCNKLYSLELREKEAKVQELEAKIKAMQVSNSINWKEQDEN